MVRLRNGVRERSSFSRHDRCCPGAVLRGPRESGEQSVDREALNVDVGKQSPGVKDGELALLVGS